MRHEGKLPPWVENDYFEPVVPQYFSLTAASGLKKIASYNPNRVAIAFATGQTGTIFYSTDPNQATDGSQGFVLQSTTLFSPFFQKDWGIMVAQDWFAATTSMGQTMTVFELKLREWPKQE